MNYSNGLTTIIQVVVARVMVDSSCYYQKGLSCCNPSYTDDSDAMIRVTMPEYLYKDSDAVILIEESQNKLVDSLRPN